MTTQDEREVEALMQRYFDGLYHADSEILRSVFHPELSYVNATAGDHEVMALEPYMTRIDNRTSPAELGEAPISGVDRITLTQGQMGFVEAHGTMLNRDYQDLLTLIRTDDGWKVISKVFTYRVREG